MPDQLRDQLREQLQSTLGTAYTLERELGGGGMSRVFVVDEVRLRRKLVVKVLSPELSAGVSAERFQREIELAASLQQANIVPLLAVGETDGLPYYTMPFVEGLSLRARLAKGPLPLGESITILRDVARALAYAHAHGVVHRDIKPENVLLSGGAAVVTDFGIAKALSASKTQAPGGTLTVIGTSLGTPAYMAPEQAVGDKVDERADIYAWGVVAYELLTGAHPFAGKNTAQQLIAAHIAERPRALMEMRAGMPPVLASLVMRTLEKAPSARPQSVPEILQVLDDPALLGNASSIRVPSQLHSTAKWTVQNVAAAVIALLVLGAVTAGRGRIASALHLSSGGNATVPAAAGVAAGGGDDATAPGKSIAVLPFDNLSVDSSNAYFAAGVQDEILTRLAGIHQLKVISRTSAGHYPSHPDDVEAVARQLGVATLLEGSIQRAGGQVRINVQLVDAHSKAHVWAQTYDRDVTNIFAVETDVAQKVAEALKAQLLPAEAARIAALPTRSASAYDYFLRAEYATRQVEAKSVPDPAAMSATGIELYKQAIAQDSTFALAYARLSYLTAYRYWFGYDRSPAQLELAERADQRALALQPELPEGHIALGYVHYRGHRDYAAALREFELARNSLPNDARVESAIAFVRRREGDFRGAESALQRAATLDPLNSQWPDELGFTLMAVRRYGEADAAFARSLVIEPHDYIALTAKAWALIQAGLPARASQTLAARAPGSDPATGEISATEYEIAWLLRQPDSALAILARTPRLVRVPTYQLAGFPASLLSGNAWAAKGDSVHARHEYDDARRTLEQMVKADPSEPAGWARLGVVYAGLGRSTDAIRAGRHAVDLRSVSQDAFDGPMPLALLAEIYVRVGQPDSAIVLLRQLLAIPAGSHISVPLLRLDPTWDPIRSDPRFKALLTEFSATANRAR